MNIATIGIDLAKKVFQLHGVNCHGKVVLRRQIHRGQMRGLFGNLPPCLIGMEASDVSSSKNGRELAAWLGVGAPAALRWR
jgi:transposase